MKLNNRSSFTLVDILIVVVIIGVLASLAIPSHMKAKKKSEYLAAEVQAKMIASMAKDHFRTLGTYPNTINTGQTNTALGIKIKDGYFTNFSIQASGPQVLFKGGNCWYFFNIDGQRTGTNNQTDCVS